MTKSSNMIKFICLFVLCFSAACSGAAPKTAAASMKIGYTLWQGDYTLLLADKIGIFEEYGVSVEPIRYNSTSEIVTDLAGLKLDGGLLTMNDLILASNLADLKAVFVTDNGGVCSVVSTPDITKISQIRGKRIGVASHSAGELFVTNMLKTSRMTFKDVTFVEIPPSQVPGAIPSGADAGVVWEPYTSQAISQGEKVLYESEANSSLLPKLLAFRTSIVKQNPGMIRNFILGWDEAVKYRADNPIESLAIITKAIGLPAEQVAMIKGYTFYSIRDNLKLFSVNPDKDPTSIYHIAEVNRDFLVTNGYMTTPPILDSLLDPSFLK